jgi:ABC-type sugar transport system substrate-binding protein
MKMKKRLALVLVLFILTAFIGAVIWAGGVSEKKKMPEGTKKLRVAYSSVGDPNPWFIGFSEQMAKEAEKRGYEFRVTHAQAKIEKQIADVEDLVAQKPDILILGPIDVEGSAEALPIAKKAGVPVLVVNRDIRGKAGVDYITRIYSDFEFLGAKECEVIHDVFGSSKQINVVELHGTPGGGNTIGLSKGFREQMKKYPNMKLVASQLGDYNRATALKSMENIIQSGVKFNAVFGHFDEEALGAIQALKAVGYKVGSNPDAGEIVIVGNGGIKDALKAIKTGEYHGLVTCSPYYANQVFDAIEAYKRGEKLPDYIRVNDFVIDGKNIDEYMWFGF